ncbi:MAG: hypothetical protein H0U67_06395, partial [Gemmatimonadetes bacterium]|nr:hypothetical protein [Gemmatimonadota bacterium]
VALGVTASIPVGVLVHPVMSVPQILVAAAIPVLASGLYVAANSLPRIPQQRPWDWRLQSLSVAASVLLMLPFFISLHR